MLKISENSNVELQAKFLRSHFSSNEKVIEIIYYRVPHCRKTAKLFALTREPRAIFSRKLQQSVFFGTINILF